MQYYINLLGMSHLKYLVNRFRHWGRMFEPFNEQTYLKKTVVLKFPAIPVVLITLIFQLS